jgi:hypothetical protein
VFGVSGDTDSDAIANVNSDAVSKAMRCYLSLLKVLPLNFFHSAVPNFTALYDFTAFYQEFLQPLAHL